ncbi:hypothetical protein HPB50_029462 [Hyalomma asiaticum]|nr:hypothetical protein HPB50_029462 [Hyalomma asiaticum]
MLKTLTSLTIGGHTYQCMAYVAPPPGATRGVVSNACDDETPAQLYQDLKQTKQPQTQQRGPGAHVDNFPRLSPGHTQPTQRKQAWTVPLNQGWGPLPTSTKHASSLTTTSTLQGDLAKSREEAAAAKAEAQAARAEAAALREHIAKLEAQISTLATGLPAPPTPTPNASQPPPPNPPTAPVLPNHLNADIYANSLVGCRRRTPSAIKYIFPEMKELENEETRPGSADFVEGPPEPDCKGLRALPARPDVRKHNPGPGPARLFEGSLRKQSIISW